MCDMAVLLALGRGVVLVVLIVVLCADVYVGVDRRGENILVLLVGGCNVCFAGQVPAADQVAVTAGLAGFV